MKLKPFNLQAAGHGEVLASEDERYLVKPCLDSEIYFYESCDECNALRKWLPQFYGKWDTEHARELQLDMDGLPNHALRCRALVLENITHSMKYPCVMDIKLGRQLWALDASPEKRARLDVVSQLTTSGSLGFRITGILVWDKKSQSYATYSTAWGKTLGKDTILQGLAVFFSPCSNHLKNFLVERFSTLLADFEKDISSLPMEFRSSSLLLAYDLEGMEDRMHEPGKNGSSLYNMKLIDLAHSTWTLGGADENTLFGVRSLRKCFQKLS
ncbi:inositol polyphosphate kinase [Schizosaccharomyces cryophilus OY26]|uniref:Kinase n=1 Tax=Schizosaccharomyces cryophilus (strain OY26 / ATCC MYA-4695 / CBS 11777 / NBRC 106824 / NRRL Y48691) TaxID=653667 RepID=S9X3Q5_SCHCR|nr:inositol polyphosphate kinase [Schizosaccharomyces cryophilus OY26]EPY51732.1 inositol polyphosphate kinase [Schizosaccharomyces cryophilus OY26]